MTKCAIVGGGGHGKVIAEIAELNGYEDIHFYDDRWPDKKTIEHWIVYGTTTCLEKKITDYNIVVVAIGDNKVRLSKQIELESFGAKFDVLIHPSAVISKYAKINTGSVIMARATINPFVQIGKACIINTGALIDHDCTLGDAVHISPNASLAGAVTIGNMSWLCIGAQIKQLITIGKNTVVGAGATVINNVFDNQTVVGTPAKPISRKG